MRAFISNSLRKLASWLERQAKAEVPEWTLAALRPLTPRYSPKRHGLYLSAIEESLKDPRVRNVALTGSYGVGKSSVLLEVARVHRKRAMSISLSTLGLDAALAEGTTSTAASSKTNQIQKEIVKQLLYSQDPGKMPGSNFERSSRFRRVSRGFLSLLIAIPVLVVFVLTKWSDGLAGAANFDTADYAWMYLYVYASAAVGAFVVLRLAHNRIQLNQVTAGSATISLAPKSATYFDQYLDEIVYLFEINPVDLVIFEDIDRFDDPHIFETLRSLNTLLNGAKQLNGRSLRFVYAIKDSIFDELGLRSAQEEASSDGTPAPAQGSVERARSDAATAELARANRTKFFDLVIPMVPFITHLSARDLLLKQMKGTKAKLHDELIDLAGRSLADMRLIKDVRNEFIIFNDRVVTGGTLKLTQDGVFAMVLYKTLHLTDFERIRLGESDLDLLYADFRTLIAAAITACRAKISAADKQLQALKPVARRGESYGAALSAEMTGVALQLGYPRWQLAFNGRLINADELQTDDFWTEVADNDQQMTVTMQNNFQSLVRNLTKDDVAHIVTSPLKPTTWVETRQRVLKSEIAKETEASDFLGHATMATLAARDDWRAEVNAVETDFEGLLEKHLKSDLARRLVRDGYIDRNFTLYTSRYYTDRVSAEATNYIIKNIDLNQIDIYAALSNEDVAAILRERGTAVLREPAAYNINILDYLLNEDPVGAAPLFDRLAKFGERERRLVLAYFEAGAAKDKLVAALTPRWAPILPFLVSELAAEPDKRLDFVDVALMELVDGVNYEVDDQVVEFLGLNYRDLAALTDNADVRNSSTIAAFLAANGPTIPDLAPLSEDMLDAIIKAGAYEITRPNLVLASGVTEPSLALDALDRSTPNVYSRVVRDLPDYVSALNSDEVTIAENDEFVPTLEKVLKTDPSSVADVIRLAAPKCTVSSGLTNISTELWQPLARAGRLRVDTGNLFDYVVEFGFDEALAPSLIAADLVVVDADETDSSKQRIASEIISAATLPSTAHRATLAASLELDDYLPVASVPVVPGHLVGDLIAADVIKDDAASFGAVEPEDAEGRAYAIGKSTEFINFMTPTEVPVTQVAALLQSPIVPAAVKEALIARFDEFTSTAGSGVLSVAARYAVTSNLPVSLASVLRLASAGVETRLVTELLVTHLPSSTLGELTPVLVAMGNKYKDLISSNGRHPKFDDTDANRQLLERMRALGTVKTWGPDGARLKANMFRP